MRNLHQFYLCWGGRRAPYNAGNGNNAGFFYVAQFHLIIGHHTNIQHHQCCLWDSNPKTWQSELLYPAFCCKKVPGCNIAVVFSERNLAGIKLNMRKGLASIKENVQRRLASIKVNVQKGLLLSIYLLSGSILYNTTVTV